MIKKSIFIIKYFIPVNRFNIMDEKEIVLKALDRIDKWYVMLAGIKDNNLLIVSKKVPPNVINIDGVDYTIKYYDPEDYLRVITQNEEEFRSYRIYYFVKVYMRKVLDILSSLEVQRMSEEFEKSNEFFR
ncbi:hypothetical protein SJAV_07510 [Sulfurisphaera javensis]|uniref:Uncharacterized protein n=1 Tax=Sulfurisphaera javensis TaxID=2049879 RepID=A0AAT9GPJ0_9CREN